ncbi:SGNH/GDSL hydrolase family protein [Vibrio mexicanus]|uniref:SGNH/GDSL hydrolase family protein n=1 Tax=Vibrio mexicanus TaxID=1004326 RepID=UPI00063C6A64|nr:SGNH/GDSL hydrolase family protein [Vibrio mexicanus]
MNRDKLKAWLENSDYIDLPDLYQEIEEHYSLYDLIDALKEIKREHGLTSRLSIQKTQIENLVCQSQELDIKSQLEYIVTQSDTQQRGHSVSRYIQSTDNHRRFTPKADIVMFGDSITEWGPWNDALDYKIVNRGIAGDTTQGMLKRIDTSIVVKPDFVCVMAGINDLAQGYSVDQVFANYKEMLAIWKESDCQVLVQSTLLVGKRLDVLNSQVNELNQRLEALCAKEEIEYLDVNSVLVEQGMLDAKYSCDDLHLNAIAYEQWLVLLKERLAKLL